MGNSLIDKQIINKIFNMHLAKGYVSEDFVFNSINEHNLPLHEIDKICDELMSLGVIIRDDMAKDFAKNEVSDRSQIDYEELFNEVIKIDETLKPFIEEIRRIQPPGNREAQNLIPQAIHGNVYAKNRVISMYLKAVVRIGLWYYHKYRIPLADAIQDGAVGLIKAIEKFDVGKQDKFATYSPWWIRQMISREAPAVNRTVYYPVHIKEKLFSIYDLFFEHECEQCNGENVCKNLVNEITERINCSESQAVFLMSHLIPLESVEDLAKDQDDFRFSDNGLFEEELMSRCYNKEIRAALCNSIDALATRDAAIIKMRFGFEDGKELTLDEVGKVFCLTRERIRQIEVKALKKLRHSSYIKKLQYKAVIEN